MSSTNILLAQSREEIENCYPVIQELRPELKDKTAFTHQIQRQFLEGYVLVYLLDQNEVAACMGYRFLETLAWGKILYIDDLITRAKSRKKGLAGFLMDYALDEARKKQCAQLHLDSGHHRHDAHRLYLNKGLMISCHHLARIFNER